MQAALLSDCVLLSLLAHLCLICQHSQSLELPGTFYQTPHASSKDREQSRVLSAMLPRAALIVQSQTVLKVRESSVGCQQCQISPSGLTVLMLQVKHG